MRRHLLHLGAVLTVTAVAVLALAAPAAAHVTVNPSTATQGGYTTFTFRVPNERDATSTVKLEISLPADTPIASVTLRPLSGWAATTDRSRLTAPIMTDDGEITEAVTKITWTADPVAAIKPGQFQEFEVSLGPLPDTDRVLFKVLQTYSDGEIVRWIDPPTADGSEPEHPAPVLTLTRPVGGDQHGTATSLTAATGSTDAGGRYHGWLDVAGVLFGLTGLVAGLLAYRKATAPG